MLDVRDLLMVRTIHEQGSLARASRVLRVGQPALTRSLARLEARLDGTLFERNRRGVIPTDLCRALLPEAIDILDRLDRLDRHVSAARGGPVQTLPIAGGPYVIETSGMVAAARMLAVHPTVRIRLIAANWADVPRMVRERQATIGILDLHGLPELPDLDVEALRPQPGLFVVRPGHPLAGRTRVDLPEILSWPLVFSSRIPSPVLDGLLLAREQVPAEGKAHSAFPALIQDSPAVALMAVQASDAIAVVTVPIAASALRAGDVVPVHWQEEWLALRPGIIRPRHRRATEAEDAYLDLLRTADREAEDAAQRFLLKAGFDAPQAEGVVPSTNGWVDTTLCPVTCCR